MSRRVVTTVGLVAAAGAGYYFYSAGGDPKVAQKMAERDASRITGGEREARKEGEEYAQRAGKKFDDTLADAKSLGKDTESKFTQLRNDAGAKFDEARKESKEAVDDLDKTVEKKTAEAKSGISSWFGGGKK